MSNQMPKQFTLGFKAKTAEEFKRARCFRCVHYSLDLTPEACVARQTAPPPRRQESAPDSYCRQGGCLQGLEHLFAAGIAKRAPCDCCAGRGWVVRVEPRLDVRKSKG